MDFKIYKNWHYSFPLFYTKFFWMKKGKPITIICSVRFYPNCKYTLEKNKSQVNKLLGLGLFPHHSNSFRIGWYCKDDKIYLCNYEYRNKERIIEQERPIDITTSVPLEITYTPPKTGIGYLLTPYFGGTEKAPHNMFIQIFYRRIIYV